MRKTVLIAIFLVLVLVASTAFAWSVLFVSKSLPSSCNVGSSSTFRAKIKYDSRVGGVPLPITGCFHVEIPRRYKLPTVVSGSWGSWQFTAKTGAMTGKSTWEGKKEFTVFGEIQRTARFSAIANKKGKSQSYIGTGPRVLTGADYYKGVTIK